MTNIEQLKKETDEIKKGLDELKSNVSLSETEKKNKAEALKTQVETTKQKIQAEIDALKDKTDDESKKEKEQAETLLASFNETMNLYASILNSTETKPTEEKEEKTEEEKGFFGKTKDWIGDQRNDVWDKEKWKEETGKNLLRTTGFVATGVGAMALAYKGIKKLWNWAFGDKKEESDEEETETKPKEKGQSFRKTGWGNFLKRTGIVGATGGGIYGISKLLGGKKEESQTENIQEGGDTISDDMFKQLLEIEGNQNFTAKTHKQKFGEDFATGPYGMVYKHIDENGNLLDKPVPFSDGEQVNKEWAEKNARILYNKRAKEWKNLLDSKGYKYNQNMLDALVSTCGGTTKARNNLKNYILSHRNNKNDIFNFISKHATTAAGNGQTMPGLVRRRKFEANWFIGNKQPFKSYKA